MNTPKLSPVRPIIDGNVPAASVPGGTDYTKWGRKTYAGNAHGIIVQSIGYNTANIVTVWIGFNQQPPVLFNIRDAYHAPDEFRTVEIYNATSFAFAINAVIFDGRYNPSNVAIGSPFIISSSITSETTLAAAPTVGLNPGTFVQYIDDTDLSWKVWQLRFNNTGTPSAGVVVPLDWSHSGNPSVWYQANP